MTGSKFLADPQGVHVVSFRYRKFPLHVTLFAWNYIANLPNGVWNYHLLNHMQFSYTLMNAMSVMYTVLFLPPTRWRKSLRRYSW